MMTRRRSLLRQTVAVAAGTLALSGGAPTPVSAHQLPDQEVRDLTELAVATAPFHDVDAALAAGWSEEPMCMEYPNGFHGEEPGTMGNHFYHVPYLTDGGHIEPAQPELLLYERRRNGEWRLNAVEYVIPAADLPGTAEPPRLFGQEFRFYPEIGSAGIWGLHVWIWRHNPRGLYVNLHPHVSCEYADLTNTMETPSMHLVRSGVPHGRRGRDHWSDPAPVVGTGRGGDGRRP